MLKCENLNPTGAFKVRGGVYLLSTLDDDERARGVVAASTGNHGQSVAYAARLFGTRASVFMSEAANPLKAESIAAMGAEIVRTGRDFDAARLAAEEYGEHHGRRSIHSSNEPDLVAGVATAALELLEAFPEINVLFVPVGGGSGVLRAGVVVRAVNPAIRVIGVQAEVAPAVYRSWREGQRIVTEDIRTFAEGLATREPFAMPLALFPRLVDEIMLVDNSAIADAIRLVLETSRRIAEGAGAASVAAAMSRRDELAGKTVGMILSGGNITGEQPRRVLAGDRP